jgi:hypothetical protein
VIFHKGAEVGCATEQDAKTAGLHSTPPDLGNEQVHDHLCRSHVAAGTCGRTLSNLVVQSGLLFLHMKLASSAPTQISRVLGVETWKQVSW